MRPILPAGVAVSTLLTTAAGRVAGRAAAAGKSVGMAAAEASVADATGARTALVAEATAHPRPVVLAMGLGMLVRPQSPVCKQVTAAGALPANQSEQVCPTLLASCTSWSLGLERRHQDALIWARWTPQRSSTLPVAWSSVTMSASWQQYSAGLVVEGAAVAMESAEVLLVARAARERITERLRKLNMFCR